MAKNFPSKIFQSFVQQTWTTTIFSQIKNSKFYKIFPNRNFPKIHQVFPRWYLQRVPQDPKQKFSQVKISKFHQCSKQVCPQEHFFKNTPNMAYKISQLTWAGIFPPGFPNKILKIKIQIHQFQIFPTTKFFHKIISKISQKSSKLFPSRNKLFPMSFSNFPKN